MITPTEYYVNPKIFERLENEVNNFPKDSKSTINTPTGRFFYDPWIIKDEYKGTIWEKVLRTLPTNVGEARIISMEPGNCYFAHCDIDDRYHLAIGNRKSFLHCFETNISYVTEPNGNWYDMDAGVLHTAVNADSKTRYQLVVRKLLLDNKLQDPIKLKFTLNSKNPESRFAIDQEISKDLNRANKSGRFTNFYFDSGSYYFEVEREDLDYYLKEYQRYIKNTVGMLEIV